MVNVQCWEESLAALNWDRSRREIMMATAATEQRLEEAALQDAALLGHSGFGGDPRARDDHHDFRQALKEELYGGVSQETRTSDRRKGRSSTKRQPTARSRTADSFPRVNSVPAARSDSPASPQSPDARLARLLEEIGEARKRNRTDRVLGLCGDACSVLGKVKGPRADQARRSLKGHLDWAKTQLDANTTKKPASRPVPPSKR
ncbi:hypothetical protein [Sphaerisporangium melleum]|uniref:hypothetical protein n=1 Tax=Sphaerisporangium melleum TaxID=321316 RepID=UPI00166454EC|nr:hypothetical protein [Sphaerisporangium melleum]